MAMNVETTKWRRDGIDDVVVDEAEVARRRRRRRTILIVLLLVVLAAVAAIFLFSRRGEQAQAPTGAAAKAGAQQLPAVTFIQPGRQQVGHTVTATGSLAARHDMPVGVPGEGGQISRVLVEQGTWVRAGQVLATIDRSVQTQEAAQLGAQIAVAQADLRLAQQNLDRAQRLVSRGFVSTADIDRLTSTRDAAQARVRVAQATLGGNRARVGRLDIRAPANGLVLARSVEPGQVVGAASGALFRIAEGGEMELRARLPQDELARVTVGIPAVVTPVGSDRNFQGRVSLLPAIIDPQTRQGEVRIAIPYDAVLRPGGFAQARLEVGQAVAPLLPESAVQSDDNGNYVYIIDGNNEVQRRNIRIGDVNDRGVSVVEGLNGDERVVLLAAAFLNPGQKVRPEPQQQPAAR